MILSHLRPKGNVMSENEASDRFSQEDRDMGQEERFALSRMSRLESVVASLACSVSMLNSLANENGQHQDGCARLCRDILAELHGVVREVCNLSERSGLDVPNSTRRMLKTIGMEKYLEG